MKVVIIGAGIIGVTSAYFLAKAGCEVTVLERHPGPAQETSFANAGQISPGYSAPWAAPSIPMKAVKWLLSRHSPLVVRPKLDPAQWLWMLKMLGNCTETAYHRNKARMVRVAEYSRDVLEELRQQTGIEYNHRTQGTLQVFRYAKQMDGMHKDIDVLKQFGVNYEVLDRDGCVAAEPGLQRVREKITGGLRLPHDETGDCRMFTIALARLAREMGVTFKYGTEVKTVLHEAGRVTGIATQHGDITGDAYILAAGSLSVRLAKTVGIHLPIYPVKGYSINVPIDNEDEAPRSTLMDETYKVAITRLGDTVRIGGTAELNGYASGLPDSRRNTLLHSFRGLFPNVGTPDNTSLWAGFRPMTPDGTPIIGGTALSNLFLNTGHGTLGWTMSCGSARVITDIIMKKTPDIDVSDLVYPRIKAA